MRNQPDIKTQIGVAVAIAACSALATGLIGWGLEELKVKFGSKKPDQKQS